MNAPPDDEQPLTPADPWTALRVHTPARIALGRSGASLPTREVLAFGIAHAQARDAVHAALDVAALHRDLDGFGLPILEVRSAAATRAAYLARPDWGRRLDASSVEALMKCATPPDVLFVIADGLSAIAPQRHAAALLAATLPLLADLAIGPLVIATQARVALADAVAIALGARLVVSLIGERPGLSAPDSLGAYVTFAPKAGTTDAERNCLSNIRPQGLGYEDAARQLAGLIRAALVEGISGVALRFEEDIALPLFS
ncbi:ethanolamine ammonia-lyase subunit EutC [Nevskia sp.]|uniref:ethanolamine ammonia-lyase subunit EutC n=1 Tax=Nevskia sp. TaxID=1929292 RepID=UPI0025F39E70|nr:ethanolamine ammonia-lyase subunit EutC [Nevskia sp.]